MDNQQQYLKRIFDLLKSPSGESLAMSMDEVHHKGLFSLVIGGTEHGKLTRVFIASKKIKPFAVQLHSHRYNIKLTAVKGVVVQHEAAEGVDVKLSKYHYQSPLNGGSGLTYQEDSLYDLKEYSVPVGSSVEMGCNAIHTVSCTKGSIWIVEEKGFETERSVVLGVPFILTGLYKQPKQFQVNDSVQLVMKELKKILIDYEIAE